MNVLLDGSSIFVKYKEAILVFFGVVLGLGFYSIKHTNFELNPKTRLLAAFSIGSVVLCVITYAIVILSCFLPFLLRPVSYIVLFFSIFVLLYGIHFKKIGVIFDIHIILGAIILFLLLFLRLAFLKDIILPPYSDSPIHYQIVSGFLHPNAINNSKLSFENIISNYYHFGFHSLAAWLTTVAKVDPEITIPLLGQLFLVIGPVSVLFLAYTLTNDLIGALFAGLLAAIGWYMPSFAANWGKYPAIAALATTPSVIAFFILHTKSVANKKVSLILGILLLIGLVLMHTRIIVLLLLTVICLFISNRLKIESEVGLIRSVGFSFLYLLSLFPLLKILTDFYSGLLVFAVLLVLLPPAFKVYPRLSVGVFLFTFGTWFIGIIPTIFNNSYRPLLDKQFLEMLLYIPFSIMGGTGIAGIIKKISFTGILRWSVISVFFAGVLFNFLKINSIYPDPCCDYFDENDRLAFEWIQKRTSGKSLVLISTSSSNGQTIGTDAGIWLFPLIGQPTNKLPSNIDWDSYDEIEGICQHGTEALIYMGGRQYSFDDNQISNEEWARLVFKSGKTKIYQVSECQK